MTSEGGVGYGSDSIIFYEVEEGMNVTRSAIGNALLLFLLVAPARADQPFQLINQMTFGVEPAVVKYIEYENKGRIVSVMMMDPSRFDFSVVFANPPMTVGQFHDRLPKVLLTVNGGYWDDKYRPTDLCIADGRIIKAPNTRNRHFGLFSVSREGNVAITDMASVPWSSVDLTGFRHALKSGPHLIRRGRPLAFNAAGAHMRTVMAITDGGNVIFTVSKTGAMTYAEMAAFLMGTGLGVTDAFNLDGGRSAGFVLGRGADRVQKDSWQVADVIQVIEKVEK
ncbi:MAG: phosphodiester glycosidase family protein [Deltaproteobacteria bacterium]|nr:phosphodiester glycosidase family protein [Deltaproteobacteria bacterium]